MKLQPNIGSDRSWVWKVAADYSEDPPTSETLAIRFANADSWYIPSLFSQILMIYLSPVAVQFKKAFEDARDNNAKLAGAPPPYSPKEKHEESAESGDEEQGEDRPAIQSFGTGEAKGNAPAPSETNPPAGEPQNLEKKDEE